MGENALFWADRNFWLMGWPGSPKIGRGPISAMLHTPLLGISISMKNKKVMLVESYVMPKKSKIMVAPPPFGTQCPYFPGLSWDVGKFENWIKKNVFFAKKKGANFPRKSNINIRWVLISKYFWHSFQKDVVFIVRWIFSEKL